MRQAVEASLERLQTDRIDHYQLHQPDPDVPVEETLGALHELVTEGKVRELGCSNFSGEQIDEAARQASERSSTPFRSCQNHYSIFTRDPEAGVLDACERNGLAFVPFFPLESGLLTGKYKLGEGLPEGSRLPSVGQTSWWIHRRRQARRRGPADHLGRRARAQPARARLRVAAVGSAGFDRHRWRDITRSDPVERRCWLGGLGTDRR